MGNSAPHRRIPAWRTRHARPALDSREIVWASAVINNASACLRWLAALNLEEARKSASLVIADGHRAGEIIGRIRALAKKAPPQKDWLDPNETIGEVIAMAGSEVRRNHISLQTQLANDLPLTLADRIQLQQVILNLLINAIEAMGGVSKGPRELWVARDQRAAIEELRSRFASLTPRADSVNASSPSSQGASPNFAIASRSPATKSGSPSRMGGLSDRLPSMGKTWRRVSPICAGSSSTTACAGAALVADCSTRPWRSWTKRISLKRIFGPSSACPRHNTSTNLMTSNASRRDRDANGAERSWSNVL
jgi:hypothetical protein